MQDFASRINKIFVIIFDRPIKLLIPVHYVCSLYIWFFFFDNWTKESDKYLENMFSETFLPFELIQVLIMDNSSTNMHCPFSGLGTHVCQPNVLWQANHSLSVSSILFLQL